MKKIIFFFILILSLSSCLRLDDNLFNLTDPIDRYYLDEYTGEQDFILDASYAIPDSLIYQFTFPSVIPGESSAKNIQAIYIGDLNTISTDTVILYCHGNKWHMDFYWQRAKLLAHTGGKNRYGVLMFDYRGYGLSEGDPSEDALYADTRGAIQWLADHGLSGNRLVIYGFSMGTAPACEISSHGAAITPSKIILEAPFASAEVMAQDGSGLAVPGSFFTSLQIDNAEEIKSIQQPFFWIHGRADLFLGIETHGEVVFANYNGVYKEAHRIEGADHGEVPEKMGFENYLNALSEFMVR